jgi:flavin-binding protein dodecin
MLLIQRTGISTTSIDDGVGKPIKRVRKTVKKP